MCQMYIHLCDSDLCGEGVDVKGAYRPRQWWRGGQSGSDKRGIRDLTTFGAEKLQSAPPSPRLPITKATPLSVIFRVLLAESVNCSISLSASQWMNESEFLADRTATQYDRLLASSCRLSVCLSVWHKSHMFIKHNRRHQRRVLRDFTWYSVVYISLQINTLLLGIGITRGQYYWILRILGALLGIVRLYRNFVLQWQAEPGLFTGRDAAITMNSVKYRQKSHSNEFF